MLLSSRQETAEDQPFFKLSSHNKSVNQHQGFFLLPISQSQTAKETAKSTSAVSMFQESATSVSHQGRQNSPFQIPASTTAAQCAFQTQQTRQRQIQHINTKDRVEEAVTHNPEKLTSLHSRLHQEADKIRRWKVETEIELKQQEQKLRDSLHTVESQRKSLLELQLQNETLSGKLQEEIDGRAELEEKIESTRDMCSLVKDYSVKLEEKLAICEKDRDDIQEVQKKQQEDLLVLENKFKELSLVHTSKLEALKSQVTEEKERNSELTKNHQNELSVLEKKIIALQEDCKKKEDRLAQLTKELEEKVDLLNVTLKEKESIQQFLQKSEAALQEYKSQVEKITQELSDLQAQITLSNKEKSVLQETIEKNEKDRCELNEVITSQRNDVTRLVKAKEQVTQEHKLLEETLGGKEEEIVTLKETVVQMTEKAKLLSENQEKEQAQLQNEKQQLQQSLETLEKQLKEVLEEKDGLLSTIKEGMQIVQRKEGEITTLKDELKDVLEREKASYDKLDMLKRDAENASAENVKLKKNIDTVQMEKDVLQQKQILSDQNAKESETQLQDMKKELETALENLESIANSKSELEKEIEKLTADREQNNISNQKILSEEKCEKETLQDEINTLEKQLASAENKNKSLQTQIVQKSKQIKELQQDSKSLKSKHSQQSKMWTKMQKEVDRLNEKLSKEQDIWTQATEELATTKATLEEKEYKVIELEEKMEELKNATDKSIKEHDVAKEACEQQMREVGATLDKYKAENQKIVAQKDKEIEKLQSKLEKEILSRKSEEKAVAKQMETEIKDLKTQAEDANKEKDRLLKENKTQQSKVEELSKLLKEKENALIQQRHKSETPVSKEQPSSQSFTESQKDGLLSPKQAVKVTPKIAKTPLTVKPVTPRQKTPSHGILKTTGDTTSAKKRSRVMFAAEKSESKQEDGSESDSSTSQLMEIEMENIPFSSVQEKQKKKGIPSQKVTPIRVKPSPRHERESPMDISPLRDQKYQQKPSTKTISLSKKAQDELTNNTRKTPKKAFRVKSWGDSPYRKKKKTTAPMKAIKQADLSWFENDTVFGFFE